MPELTHEQRVELAHRLGRSAVWALTLVGGEIAILPGLAEYVSILKSYGKYVTLSTSGIGMERHLNALVDVAVDSITFSVDSHDPEAHDAFRRRPGLFRRVEQQIETIRARRRDKPKVQVRGTINRTNFRQIEEYVDYWQRRADNVVLQIVQDNPLHAVRDREVLFREEDRPALEESLRQARERFPFLRTRNSELMSKYVFDREELREELGFRCVLMPSASFSIWPDGELRLCGGRSDTSIGNILEREIDEVWQDLRTVRTRERMKSKEFGCMCWEQASSGNLQLLPLQRLTERLRGSAR
jgi:MoaA/NifB/PqqE/SkfB family radical SAM enzyme